MAFVQSKECALAPLVHSSFVQYGTVSSLYLLQSGVLACNRHEHKETAQKAYVTVWYPSFILLIMPPFLLLLPALPAC